MNGLNNISSLQQGNLLNWTEMNAAKRMEKLATGLKINKAADDAAGLAAATKLLGQLRGTRQAERNIEDGVSLIQTAEGGLTQVNDQLQRIRELSVQASNDTLSNENRELLQREIDQLKQGINDIANNTNFNGIHLLNGGSGSSSVDSSVIVDLSKAESVTFYEQTSGQHEVTFTMAELTQPGGVKWIPPHYLDSEGKVSLHVGSSSYEYYTFSADLATNTITSHAAVQDGDRPENRIAALNNIKGVQLNGIEGYDTDEAWAANIISSMGPISPDYPLENSLGMDLSDYPQFDSYSFNNQGPTSITWNFSPASRNGSGQNTSSGLIIHTGPNTDQNVKIPLSDVRTSALGIDGTNAATQSAANSALAEIDSALGQVSSEQARWGSYENRLEQSYYNALNSEVNLASSESRIRDSVMAKEASALASQNLLLNIANTMTAHSFDTNSTVLALLK
ncbi:MAG: flagellin [Sporomusaceae bacterium]|jgi:flagellin|nr:flagellin [Sporomusaceae bacterium]